jgi:hypothetical protein
MKMNLARPPAPATRLRHHGWAARLLLALVLLGTLALPASAASLPDVDCGREGTTCLFVGEFTAVAIATITLSDGSSTMHSVFLPAIMR